MDYACLLISGALLSCVVSARSMDMPVAFDAVLSLEASPPAAIYRYGVEASQQASLWLPASSAPAPVVALIHGGCWLEDYSAGHVTPLAAQLARDGFAVWVPEYRRVGEEGGGWPGTFADIERSFAHLAVMNDPRLDLSRLLLMGHSAGGHLALWLASREPRQFPAGMRLRGVVGLAAITDLVAYAAGSNSCEAVTSTLMGGAPSVLPARYHAASPADLPLQVATILLRGERDPIVPRQQLTALGGRPGVTVRELPEAGHFDWIHPRTRAYELVHAALQELLLPRSGTAP